MTPPMKVLSLFDGISCGRVALERAGIKVERYVAYEIDRYAIEVSSYNYPDIEHKGSVVGVDYTQYKDFDIVMGGFPCTDLSLAKANRQGLRGLNNKGGGITQISDAQRYKQLGNGWTVDVIAHILKHIKQ